MNYAKIGSALVLAALIAGCGGGGGSDPAPAPGNNNGGNTGGDNGGNTGGATLSAALAGRFLDAPVEGLKYTLTHATGHEAFACEATACVTDVNGTFQYHEGDSVTFALGSVTLGTVTAAGVVTPATVAAAVVAANPTADATAVRNNLLVFLQSLDEDGDPENGITISSATAGAVAADTVNFTAAEATFTSQVTNLVSQVSTTTGNTSLTVVSHADAVTHFDGQLAKGVAGNYVLPDADGKPNRTLSLLASGRYLYAGYDNDPDCNEGTDANGNGMEMGTYVYDAAAKTITFTVTVESNGSCGPAKTGAPEAYDVVSFDGVAFTWADGEGEDREEFTWNRVVQGGGNSVAGGWMLPGPTLNGETVVVSFFPSAPGAGNGRYLLADGRHTNGFDPGVEAGCYSIAEGGAATFTIGGSCAGSIDTNGSRGLNGTGRTLKVDAYGRLELADANGAWLNTYMAFTNAPATKAQMAGYWYLESAPGADPEAADDLFVLRVYGGSHPGDATRVNFVFGTHHNFAAANECSADTYDTVYGIQELHGNGVEVGAFNFLPNGTVSPGIDPALGGVDTNGDCGLFNAFAVGESNPNRFLVRVADGGNALLFWGNDFEGEEVGFVFRRVKSQAGQLVGGWNHYTDGGTTPDKEETVFFPGGQVFSIMYAPGDNGIRRELYSLSGDSLVIDGPGLAQCVDTIDDQFCDIADTDFGVTFNAERTVGSYDDDGNATLEEMRKSTQP